MVQSSSLVRSTVLYKKNWPYKRLLALWTQNRAILSWICPYGTTPNWPYIHFDLTSVALTSGANCSPIFGQSLSMDYPLFVHVLSSVCTGFILVDLKLQRIGNGQDVGKRWVGHGLWACGPFLRLDNLSTYWGPGQSLDILLICASSICPRFV